MKVYYEYLIIINIITLIVFGIDKLLAIRKKRRISEMTLFILSFLGGCFLELIGMFLFHHKTLKIRFYVVNMLFIIMHVYVWYNYIWIK